MLSINFNPSLLRAQNKLNIASNSLNKSLQRLSTGMRINSAADDAAGYYVSQRLNSQIRGLKVAQNNVALGISMLGVAEGALGSMTDMLNRLSDLALQGASNTMTDTARGALTKEANALVEEIKKLNKNTKFNGVNVFGSTTTSASAVTSVSTDVIPSGYTAIYTAEDLKKVSGSGKYILMNDIDLSSEADWQGLILDGGIFDGNGHVIKNLKINIPYTHIGLFAATDKAEIKNLGLENLDITGGIDYAGGLVGFASATKISNCYTTGKIVGVPGNIDTGGLVGCAELGSQISNCYTTSNVNAPNTSGGLVGYLSQSTISNCYVSGNVSGNKQSGLILGISDGTVSGVWADKKDSTLEAIGKITADATITNSGAVSHEEFTSHKFWDSQNLDSAVWEMSYSIPPILKGVGGQQENWYFKRGDNEHRLQIGEASTPEANAMFINTGLDLGAIQIDLSTTESCLKSVDCIKAVLDVVAQKTSDIGVYQSRLETISNVNTTKIENLTAAYSTVTEADVAEEVANYTKSQIMAQTAASLITQTQNFEANMILRMINLLG